MRNNYTIQKLSLPAQPIKTTLNRAFENLTYGDINRVLKKIFGKQASHRLLTTWPKFENKAYIEVFTYNMGSRLEKNKGQFLIELN